MIQIHEEAARLIAAGERAAMVTVIEVSGSTPREPGAKMLVKPDGTIIGTVGGGGVEKLAFEEALKVIGAGTPKKVKFSLQGKTNVSEDQTVATGMICGGDMEVFIEPLFAGPPLYIFGGGHIALSLSKMAAESGFRVVVIDNRPEFCSSERFPEASRVLSAEYPDAFDHIDVGSSGYIVIMTHRHDGDEAVLEQALETNAAYIGMIGSSKKVAAIFSRLLKKGKTQQQLDRVHSPIGLDIGAETPQEIAVSILAELIRIRRTSGC